MDTEKWVNSQAKIGVFLNGKSTALFTPTFHRGTISYRSNPQDLPTGSYSIFFSLSNLSKECDLIETPPYEFEVIDEDAPESEPTKTEKVPNIDIECRQDAEQIIDIVRNEEEKKITVYYNNVHSLLYDEVYGKEAKEGELKEVTDKYLAPVILFALFLGEKYENIPSPEEKNTLIVSFIKAQLTSY